MDYLFEPVATIETTMPVIDLPNALPFATGNGPHNYLCGDCRNVLMSKIEMPRPQRVLMICGKCRTANLMAGSARAHAELDPRAGRPHMDQVNRLADLVASSLSPQSICNELPISVASATRFMPALSQAAEAAPSGLPEPSVRTDKA